MRTVAQATSAIAEMPQLVVALWIWCREVTIRTYYGSHEGTRWETELFERRHPMIRNMGSYDRGVRAFVLAPLAVVLAFVVGAGTLAGVILFVVAGIMLATAAIGFCPNYVWLGITTYPRGVHRVGHHIRHGHT